MKLTAIISSKVCIFMASRRQIKNLKKFWSSWSSSYPSFLVNKTCFNRDIWAFQTFCDFVNPMSKVVQGCGGLGCRMILNFIVILSWFPARHNYVSGQFCGRTFQGISEFFSSRFWSQMTLLSLFGWTSVSRRRSIQMHSSLSESHPICIWYVEPLSFKSGKLKFHSSEFSKEVSISLHRIIIGSKTNDAREFIVRSCWKPCFFNLHRLLSLLC